MKDTIKIERFPVRDGSGAEKAIHDITHIETKMYFYKGPAGGQSTYRLSISPIEVDGEFVSTLLGTGKLITVETTSRFSQKRFSELAETYKPGNAAYEEAVLSVMEKLNLIPVSREVDNASQKSQV